MLPRAKGEATMKSRIAVRGASNLAAGSAGDDDFLHVQADHQRILARAIEILGNVEGVRLIGIVDVGMEGERLLAIARNTHAATEPRLARNREAAPSAAARCHAITCFLLDLRKPPLEPLFKFVAARAAIPARAARPAGPPSIRAFPWPP